MHWQKSPAAMTPQYPSKHASDGPWPRASGAGSGERTPCPGKDETGACSFVRIFCGSVGRG